MHDLVIRGGLVADGLGGEPRRADIAIDGEHIARVGLDIAPGTEELDAQGLLVTPGFVDLHTHYDAQATWDPILAPTAWHGVTTIVTGNCGVGFAPARLEARAWLVEVMEDVEEIPVPVMNAGLPWTWESFPEFLDALDAQPHTLDIAAQVPHIALRAYVMGERAKRDETAQPDDINAMAGLLKEAMQAGAAGFACSRTDLHRTKDGSLVPGSMGGTEELLALADAMRGAGGAPIQYLGNLADWDNDFPFMKEMARRSGGSIQFLMSDTAWQAKVAGIDAAAKEGLRLVGHVPPRAVGNVLHWRAGRNPFMDRPSIQKIAHLPWEERLARLSDPTFRAQVLSENNGPGEEKLPAFSRIIYRGFDRMYEVSDYPDYEPDPAKDSIAKRAERDGVDPAAYAYDALTRNNGNGMIYMALANYRAGDLSEVRQLLSHPGTVASLSDGGAHCTRVIDASLPTFMLSHWVRDRTRGERLPLGEVVKSCTSEPAAAYGFLDRGVIAPGYLADLNVIDFERLRLPAPYMSYDFPAGGGRLLQKAEGYVATIKRGAITFSHGEHTGAFPGKVVRGPQPEPLRA